MSKLEWGHDQIPDQKGRVIIITGSTSGLGKEAARVLAGKGANIIMAVRNKNKGSKVAELIKKRYQGAKIEVMKVDLNILESVRAFAKEFENTHSRLDILINNAGIMACPFARTEDGFEIQMGVNHLGHFALTGYLLPLLQRTSGSRIVVTSSIAHKTGDINFDDINWEKRSYNTAKAYSDSKIANLYFTYELARKFKDIPNAPIVTAAHPGWTKTDLQRHSFLARILNPIFSQGVKQGVLPTLRAAVDENAKQGDYFGPNGFQEMKGAPVKVRSNGRSHDQSKAAKLWELSEELTGVHYPIAG